MTKEEKSKSLIKAGGELVGSAVGAALGFVAGGPLGAAGAGAAGVVIAKGTAELADRMLSTREAVRIGAAAAIAAMEIKARLDSGDRIRNDDFFDSDGKRSSADEVLEGVLLASKSCYEEKKAEHLGKLFSNIAFDASCTREEANMHISTAESLTYSQFVLLQLVSGKGSDLKLRSQPYGSRAQIARGTIGLLHEIHDLCNRQLVIMAKPGDDQHTIVMGINNICPAWLHLAVGGERIHELLSLTDIGDSDLENIAKWLR